MGIGKFVPPALKPTLVKWRNQAHSAWIKKFFSFTSADLIAEARKLGVNTGDTLLVHSSFGSFEGFEGWIPDAIQAMKDMVGPEGNLMMPTIPFDGSAVEYARSGVITDMARSYSRTGMLTELFRRDKEVIRSIHPTHPVAIWGKRAHELAADHYQSKTPCGAPGPFSRLLEFDGKVLLAGVDIRSMTLFHYAEEVLEPGMPYPPFTEEWFEFQTRGKDRVLYPSRMRLFEPGLSARRDITKMIEPMKQAGLWHQGRVGRLDLYVVGARDAVQILKEMAARGQYCYSPKVG